MNCPFCLIKLEFHEGPTLDDYVCQNDACQYHQMARYSCTYWDGILAVERIILTDNIYILVEYRQNKTTISKLDIVAIDDHIIINKAMKLDFTNIPKLVDKIKILIMLS